MNDETQRPVASGTTTEGSPTTVDTPPPAAKPRRGRPPKTATGSTAPSRRGRPPKSASRATAKHRGRPRKAETLVAEFEREVEARFQAKLNKAEAQIAELRAELKAAKKRERDALKLFEKQEKALTKFITSWNGKALAKVQKDAAPKKRRGRPRKTA